AVRLQPRARQPRALLDGARHHQSPEILGAEEYEEHRRPANRFCPGQYDPATLTPPGPRPMSTKEDPATGGSWAGMIAIVGFVLMATTQVTNMILARGLAGT